MRRWAIPQIKVFTIHTAYFILYFQIGTRGGTETEMMGVPMLWEKKGVLLSIGAVVGIALGLCWLLWPVSYGEYVLVCPHRFQIDLYLENGASVETKPCSIVSESKIEDSRSSEIVQSRYLTDWQGNEVQVEVFDVKMEGIIKMYALRQFDDESIFASGLQVGEYELWDSAPSMASVATDNEQQ